MCTTDPLRPTAIEERHWQTHTNGKAHRKMARGPQDNARDRWLATVAARERGEVGEGAGEPVEEGVTDSSSA